MRRCVLGFVLVLFGCPADEGRGGGGAGTEGGGVVAPGDPQRLCRAHLAWEQRCAAAMPEEPPALPYWGESECPGEPWEYVQPAFLDAASECFGTLACDRSDDACMSAGFAAIGVHSEADIQGDALVQRCLTLAQSCAEVLDDACVSLVGFTAEGRELASACLDLPCPEADACLRDPGGER